MSDAFADLLAASRDGVLFVGPDRIVHRANAPVAVLLGRGDSGMTGRTLEEAIPQEELRELVQRVLAGETRAEGEFRLLSGEERFFLATAIRSGEGAIVILEDLTRLKHLEQIRRDFVANVSHELKTPITAIKGFIETLRDGALRDPENAGKFLEIVAKQADRLNAIIEDLLSLARIEQDAERGEVALETAPLSEALEDAREICAPRAAEKRMRLELDCPVDLMVPHNRLLVEQAVVNLIDNAVKYSEPERLVRVTAERREGEALIRVSDQGHGIPQEHLPRLFERFYRVDKARSRKLGGTGLGLAIVKHICAAHGGTIEVESEIGKGSVFLIRLPL